MTIKKYFKVFPFLFFLYIFLIVPSTSLAIEEEVLPGEIFNCQCFDMKTSTKVGAFCTDNEEECSLSGGCKQFFKPGMRPEVFFERCYSNPCSAGMYESGIDKKPFSNCMDCKTVSQKNPYNGTILECTEYFPNGESSLQEFADPPDVTLEVPFGSTNNVNDISEYISVFYSYIVPVIAIAAVIMIMFGGFKYATAAGNSSMVASAKKTIANAIIGLVLALTSFLLLYTINPNLVSLNSLKIPFVQLIDDRPIGNCSEIKSGPCSIEALEKTCFKNNAQEASGICGVESQGNEIAESGTDKCKNDPQKRPFSIGLFQINLTVHSLSGLDCPSAFKGKNYDCQIINEDLYAKCVTKAKEASANIAKACELSNNGDAWHAWGKCGGSWGSNSKCCYNYL